jgi:cohesin complex subunit SCC1
MRRCGRSRWWVFSMIHPRLLLTRSQAFRPGNIDLPAQTHVANPTNLILPDQITDLDLLAPMPDPSFLLSQPLVPDWDNSQFLSGSIEQARMEPMELPEDDLNLDIGEGDDLEPGLAYDEGTSIEVGRNAPLERRQSEEFTGLDKNLVIDDDDLGIDIGEDPPTELARGPELIWTLRWVA